MEDSQGQATPQPPPASALETNPAPEQKVSPLEAKPVENKPRVRVDQGGNPVIPPGPVSNPGSDRLPLGQRASDVGELKSSRDRRIMRWIAFVMYGATSLLFFLTLLYALTDIVTNPKLIYLFSQAPHPPLIFAGIVIVVLASVPLSIAHALMHMGSEPSKTPSDKKFAKSERLSITTPNLEAARTIAEFLKDLMFKEGK